VEAKTADAPKAPAPIDLSPAGVKASLDTIQVVATSTTEARLKPEVMFVRATANTIRKKKLFETARKAFKALQAAQEKADNLAAAKNATPKAIKAATDAVTEAQGKFDDAITSVKEYVRKVVEGEDAALKALRQKQAEAEAKVKVLTAPKPRKAAAKGKTATPEEAKAAEEKAAAELTAAQTALTQAKEAVAKREQEIDDEVEAGEYGPVDVERTFYKITVDGETISLYDHVEAYATNFEKGIEGKGKSEAKSRVVDVLKASGLSGSRQKILGGISSQEGGFTATQTWDSAVLTWGFVQWTGGERSDLIAALILIKQHAPEAFKARFQKYGIDVDKKKRELVITKFKEPEGGAKEGETKPPVAQQVKGDPAALAVREEETPKLAAVFSRAGLDPDIQAAQVKAANYIEIDRPLAYAFEVTFPPRPAPEAPKEAKPAATPTATPTATPPAATPAPAAAAPAKPPEAKKPDPPVKKQIRAGEIMTSEFGVGMLANRTVHYGLGSAQNIVRDKVREFVQKEKPDPEDIKSWAAKAEAAVLTELTEEERAQALIDFGCSKDPGTFDPPPAAAAEEKK
jgi:hypothetical protein